MKLSYDIQANFLHILGSKRAGAISRGSTDMSSFKVCSFIFSVCRYTRADSITANYYGDESVCHIMPSSISRYRQLPATSCTALPRRMSQ